jgi:Tfp pilus assembly protein PilN
MFSRKPKDHHTDATFLPEDYVSKLAERRSNLMAVSLFVIVTLGVVGAFFVTNRQWNDVKRYQQAMNVRYTKAAADIEQLKVLEDQKNGLLQKAELTTALIERVPRSILLAELINRMPKRVVMLEMQIKSERLDKPIRAATAKAKTMTNTKKPAKKGSVSSKKDAAEVPKAPDPIAAAAPRLSTTIVVIGVAPSHKDIARFVAQLQGCGLLTGVELKFSETTIIQDREMKKFRVEARIADTADARRIEPLETPRIRSWDDLAPDPEELMDDEGVTPGPAAGITTNEGGNR